MSDHVLNDLDKLMQITDASNPMQVCQSIEKDLNTIVLFKQTYEEKIDISIATLVSRSDDIHCDILEDGTLYPFDCDELQDRMIAALAEQNFMVEYDTEMAGLETMADQALTQSAAIRSALEAVSGALALTEIPSVDTTLLAQIESKAYPKFIKDMSNKLGKVTDRFENLMKQDGTEGGPIGVLDGIDADLNELKNFYTTHKAFVTDSFNEYNTHQET